MGKKKKHETGFSERLAQLIAQRDLTQKEAASLAGITPSVFSGWLNGTSTPSDILAVQRLCKALSTPPNEPVSFEELLTGTKSDTHVAVFSENDLARILSHEDPLYEGYLHIKATKVSFKKR